MLLVLQSKLHNADHYAYSHYGVARLWKDVKGKSKDQVVAMFGPPTDVFSHVIRGDVEYTRYGYAATQTSSSDVGTLIEKGNGRARNQTSEIMFLGPTIVFANGSVKALIIRPAAAFFRVNNKSRQWQAAVDRWDSMLGKGSPAYIRHVESNPGRIRLLALLPTFSNVGAALLKGEPFSDWTLVSSKSDPAALLALQEGTWAYAISRGLKIVTKANGAISDAYNHSCDSVWKLKRGASDWAMVTTHFTGSPYDLYRRTFSTDSNSYQVTARALPLKAFASASLISEIVLASEEGCAEGLLGLDEFVRVAPLNELVPCPFG